MSTKQSLESQETHLGPDSPQALIAMSEAKALIDPYRRLVHSVILFGSYALGRAERESDLDVLVILENSRKSSQLKRRFFDMGFELNTRSRETGGSEVQLVVFDEKEIKHLFRLATPLVLAIRQGVIIWDDGFFNALLAGRYPKWPTRGAAEEALVHWIIGQYYLSAIDLKREIRRDHGTAGICTEQNECIGHFKGDILARVISRMLYVTLPERGELPLTKHDLEKMAVGAYGKEWQRPISLALEVLREDRAIDDKEFDIMFPFARKLFRECVEICGRKNPKVMEAIRSHVAIYKSLGRRDT